VSVIVTAVVVTLAAGGLLRVLERRTPRARRLWTGTASAVWVVSFAGPATATTPLAGLALAALHLVVGAVVIVGLRRRHPDRVA
jgi:succinate dehydrogenase hydrophobic anchor subunit